jgi:hypothetical protein
VSVRSNFYGETASITREENSDPEGRLRYPSVFKHRLLVSKVADHNISTPESASISTRRVPRGPHTEISREEYERAVAARGSSAPHGRAEPRRSIMRPLRRQATTPWAIEGGVSRTA